jgi:hypothetical protein
LLEDNFTLAATFRSHVLSHFPAELANQSRLYAHVRSGDIFARGLPFGYYVQPPCKYYVDAMRFTGLEWHDVTVIAENVENPCVSVLAAFGAQYKQQALFDDLGALLRAKMVALSRGSFGAAVIYLSAVQKIFYTFACDAQCSRLGHRLNCEPSTGYFEALSRATWTRCSWCRRLMTNASCQRWHIIAQ